MKMYQEKKMTNELPRELPVTIVVTSYNRRELLEETIKKINERTFYPYRIIVVDNASTDGSVGFLKTAKVQGRIFDHLFLPENIGQSRALNEVFKAIDEWENEKRRPSNDFIITTNEDIFPPMLGQKNCWLTQMIDILKRNEPEFGGLCMRIQRTPRNDINEFKEIIPCYKGFPSVFRLMRRSDLRQLGDRPFGRLMKWDSNTMGEKYKTLIRKKFGFATRIYADHAGFMIENRGYQKGFTEYFTYASNKTEMHKEKPYPVIDESTNIPIKVRHGVDSSEKEARDDYNKKLEQSDSILSLGEEVSVIKENSRSKTSIVDIDGVKHVKKVFRKLEFIDNEVLADKLFSEFEWMTPFTNSGFDFYTKELYKDELRLDKISKGKDKEWKKETAGEILSAVLDMYIAGYSHRDIHAKNIFVIDGQIKIIDFEYLKMVKDSIPFLHSYDITGTGLSSPGKSRRMCYTKDEPSSIWRCLDINLKDAVDSLISEITTNLYYVSKYFRTKDRNHNRTHGISYSTFDLPNITIHDGQRSTGNRIKKLSIDSNIISAKTVLDIGSNVGGMLLGIERFKPEFAIGLEYLPEQVKIANKIAAIEGFNNIKFIQGDIDIVECGEVKFDIVFCFSVNKHVKDEKKLYKTLASVTKETLYFEGNDGTDNEEVIEKLKEAGFKKVEYIGICDDDIKDSNNVRPLFIAKI